MDEGSPFHPSQRGMRARGRRRRLARLCRRVLRRLSGVDQRRISLPPDGPARGWVLFSYIIDPFLRKPGAPMPHSHTHFWESWQMAQIFREAGYAVDVIHWTHRGFRPERDYAVYVDVRRNFDRVAPQLGPGCLKIVHLDTAHYAFHNAAQARRLAELKSRRGIDLRPFKLIEPNRAIECADRATVLGNEFTIGTYRFAGRPIDRIPISTPLLYPAPEGGEDEGCRRNYLWFGSEGFVHKGLDLVLEAFAGLPRYRLFVCGPMEREPDFEAAFRKELYATQNIHTIGWVDIADRRFQRLASNCLGLVFPSCSEGGGGSVLTCMHAGLIPIVSRESSVDIDPRYGCLLPDCGVDTIRACVQELSGRPAAERRAMRSAAWRFAREHHTRAQFTAAYCDFVERRVLGREPSRGGRS